MSKFALASTIIASLALGVTACDDKAKEGDDKKADAKKDEKKDEKKKDEKKAEAKDEKEDGGW